MSRDPIVEEIHRIREELLERCNYDLDRLAAHFAQRERDSGRTYISRPPVRTNTPPLFDHIRHRPAAPRSASDAA